MCQRVREARHGIREEAAEDGVCGREQPAEECEQRQAEGDAAGDGCARSAGRLAPGNVALQEVHRAAEGCEAGRRGAGRVVADARTGDPRLRSPQRAEHDRARDRDQVGGRQQGRVAPREAGGEENERSEHPPPSLVICDAADTEQQREAHRERGRPDEDVDAERHAVKQRVPEGTERERDQEESESELRVAAHRPEMEAAAR